MKLKDFLKDRIGYALIYFVSTSIVILIMYLTLIINKINLPKTNIFYAFLVSAVLFIIFLLYDYFKNKSFYIQLSLMINSKDELDYMLNLDCTGTIEQRLYRNLLLKVYKIYGDKIGKYEEERKQYLYFINQWVHQIKTPVSVINLILQDQKNEEYRAIFDSLAEENEKISHCIEMMLYNTRLNEFNLDFNVESFNIISIVRNVINHNKKSLIRNFIFPKIIGDEDIIVETDKKWLFFVINQIFVNAIKYSKDSQKDKKYITFKINQESTKVILSVADNGIGIPPQDLSRIFNAFFTGKNGRKIAESTGMGMYLSKKICDELGHDLLVESQENQGTTFSIVFHTGKNMFKL